MTSTSVDLTSMLYSTMQYLAVLCLFSCALLAFGVAGSKQNDTETKGNTKNILGNLRVTSAKQFDLPIDFLETSSLKNQTNEFLVEQIRKLSSYLSSQQNLVRNKRQANEPKDQLTVVSLKGNIKEVNLGPLRAVTNQGT